MGENLDFLFIEFSIKKGHVQLTGDSGLVSTGMEARPSHICTNTYGLSHLAHPVH